MNEHGVRKGVLTITNSRDVAVRLRLEPWAEEHALPPATSVGVSYSGPADRGDFEVEVSVEEIVVYGWAGSLLEVVPR